MSEAESRWKTSFVTRYELETTLGAACCQTVWDEECFTLRCKTFPDLEHPVTQAEAYKTWANQGWKWPDCKVYWDQCGQQSAETRQMDEETANSMKLRVMDLDS